MRLLPKTTQLQRSIFSITAAVLLTLTSSASANPIDAFGFGGRAVGMAGAFTSLATDSSANYYNPAGLAQGEDLRFDLGYQYASPSLLFDNGDADVDNVQGLQGGVVLPGSVLGRRFGVGLSLLVLDDRITRVRSLPQQQPRFVMFDNRVQRLFISANLALEIWDNLYIGGGVTFFSDSIGQLEVTGTVSLIDSDRTALQGAIDVDLKSSRYPTAGILYAPDAPWSIGLVYRDEFYLRLRLSTLVVGDVLLDTIPEDPIVLVEEGSFFLDSRNANLFTPRQLVLGGSYQFPRVLLSADIGWYQWSRFPAPTSDITLELDLDPLEFSVPPIDPVEDPNFHDIIIPRFGVEGRAVESDHVILDVRGGYFFEPSPAPDQPGRTNYADSAKHGFSLGVGLQFIDFTAVFPKPIVFDFTFLYVLMQERTYLKDDPADLIGDYSIHGHILGFNLFMGILF